MGFFIPFWQGGLSLRLVGRYFLAISNEANLRHQQYGWLVFGVGEEKNGKKEKYIVGSAYKKGDASLLEKFKQKIARDVLTKDVVVMAGDPLGMA